MRHTKLGAALFAVVLGLAPCAFGQEADEVAQKLAEKLSAARTDEERQALLAAEGGAATPALVEALVKRGDALRLKGDFARALGVSRFALGLAERIGDRTGGTRAKLMIATARYHQGEYEAALKDYREVLPLVEALRNQRGVASALSGIGLVLRAQGDFEGALDYYRRGLAAAEAAGEEDVVAGTLNSIGVLYRLQGNGRLALEYLQKSLALSEKSKHRPNTRPFITGALNNIANVYLQQRQYELALRTYERSLALAREWKNLPQEAQALNNIGRVHRYMKDFARALAFYGQGLAIRRKLEDNVGTARSLENLAEAHAVTGEYEPALRYYEESIALFEASGAGADLAVAAGGMGQLQLARRDYRSALEWAERAINLAQKTDRLDVLWQASATAGSAHKALGQNDRARASLAAAIAAVEEMRAQVAGGEQEQQRFFEDRTSPYLLMVELLLAQGDHAGAFEYAERAKARVLLDVLQSGRAGADRVMTDAERGRERGLRGQLVALNNQITRARQAKEPDASALSDLRARREKARREFEAFRTNVYAAHPGLRVKRGEVRPLSPEEAGALLPGTRGALVEYVVAEEKTYLFVLTRGGGPARAALKVYTLGVKQEALAEQAEQFRRRLARRDLNYDAAARELYDLVLGPAAAQLRGVDALVIVPDGKLWELPFQALKAPDGRHLVERYAISYAPSLTVLREIVKSRRASPPSRAAMLLAVGNPALGEEARARAKSVLMGEAELGPLPEAERQVKALAELYGAAQSRVYTGAEAREGRFKTESGGYRILQLATHGVLNDASPMYSHVLLANEEVAGAEDGLLEAWELMNLELRADMVVLSACETARGRVGAGEGVIGMTWALFVAGSPTTVVSQWKVEAASTTELMLEFHRKLRRQDDALSPGLGSAAALQRAAKRMLATKEYRHPFYWAGFVVVGDGR